ncbi:type II toxin-antitoxin system VapB family antitoxin [Streptomyces sp. NPDC018693]|uniref:type II toxin-antitoxin system VapB family antitoxin n=1 Tax=unclassified Streptomyces TaxID=2593676 RepID=UPI0037959E96
MSKTLVEIDDAILEEVRELLGTTTKVATIREALLDVAKRGRRRRGIDAIKAGRFDFSEIINSSGPKDSGENDAA